MTSMRRPVALVALLGSAAMLTACSVGATTPVPPHPASAAQTTTAAPVAGPAPGKAPGSSAPVRPTTVAAPPTTGTGQTPQSGLNAIVAADGPLVAVSGIVHDSGGLLLAVVRGSGSPTMYSSVNTVDVFRWDGSSWQLQAELRDPDGMVFQGELPTVTAPSLTGGPEPDFVVSGDPGNSAGLYVVSDVAGRWQVDTTTDTTGDLFADADLEGAVVSSWGTDCTPDCADGGYENTRYAWSATAHAFAPLGPAVHYPPGSRPPRP